MTTPASGGFWRGGASPRLVFRLLVGATLCSTMIGVGYALLRRATFVASFPRAADPGLYWSLVLTGVVGLVALAGLWGWRRWAVVLYALLAAASLTLDVVAGAPVAHQATVAVDAVLILALAWLNRARFRPGVS